MSSAPHDRHLYIIFPAWAVFAAACARLQKKTPSLAPGRAAPVCRPSVFFANSARCAATVRVCICILLCFPHSACEIVPWLSARDTLGLRPCPPAAPRASGDRKRQSVRPGAPGCEGGCLRFATGIPPRAT